MTLVKKMLQYLDSILRIVALIFLMAMMLIIVANIIGRVFFQTPVHGALEIAGLCGVITVSVAIGLTEREKRNVTITILSSRFTPRIAAIFSVITSFLSLAGVAAVCWAVFKFAEHAATGHLLSEILDIPTAPFKFIWAFGCTLLCLYIVNNIIRSILEGIRK
jgi:TRAP-type C4-dicarboxylate transport system permease small subunit